MTYDNTNQSLISYRAGETKPLYGTISGTSGTQTVTNPKFTLVDETGAVILNAVAAQSTAAGLSTQVYYNLDSTTLNAGHWYYGYFHAPDLASADNISRTLRPTLAIWIAPIVEATYVLGSAVGNVRQAIADTNIPDPVFSDAEITNFLARGGNDVNLSASLALMAQASDRAKLAISMNSGAWGTTQTEVYKALMTLAETYRKHTASVMLVPVTKAIFTLGNTDLGTVGTMDNW